MKMILLATSFLAVSLTMPALVHAHDPKAHATASDAQISEGAKPAIDVVQQFSAVLKAADFQRACDLLAEDVLILESGGAERRARNT